LVDGVEKDVAEISDDEMKKKIILFINGLQSRKKLYNNTLNQTLYDSLSRVAGLIKEYVKNNN